MFNRMCQDLWLRTGSGTKTGPKLKVLNRTFVCQFAVDCSNFEMFPGKKTKGKIPSQMKSGPIVANIQGQFGAPRPQVGPRRVSSTRGPPDPLGESPSANPDRYYKINIYLMTVDTHSRFMCRQLCACIKTYPYALKDPRLRTNIDLYGYRFIDIRNRNHNNHTLS